MSLKYSKPSPIIQINCEDDISCLSFGADGKVSKIYKADYRQAFDRLKRLIIVGLKRARVSHKPRVILARLGDLGIWTDEEPRFIDLAGKCIRLAMKELGVRNKVRFHVSFDEALFGGDDHNWKITLMVK